MLSARYPDASGLPLADAQAKELWAALDPVSLLRLDPDELRRPVDLIPQGEPLWFENERGRGLAALYDSLQSRDVDAFLSIRARFVKLFPTVKTLRLENTTKQLKSMGLTLVDGANVGADEMSEGMLYWLAFAIIECLAPRAILLVEEPENGLYPARIEEVMKVLRAMSERTQIIIATHSPLVINELQAGEVTIVTRTPEAGTICTPMTETKNFAERSKIAAISADYRTIAVIGGIAKPTVEGWIVALKGTRDTDARSRARIAELLAAHGIEDHSTEAYVLIVDGAALDALPVGCDSLRAWLARAGDVLGTAVRGA